MKNKENLKRFIAELKNFKEGLNKKRIAEKNKIVKEAYLQASLTTTKHIKQAETELAIMDLT